MGVKDLWPVLDGIKKEHSNTENTLLNKTLAIDLSIWIQQSSAVNIGYKGSLRNLLWRLQYLLCKQARPVVVLDGRPPSLKNRVLEQRGSSGWSFNRSTDASPWTPSKDTQQCCELMDCLGVPYVQSRGEAEAMCAYLNNIGIVDGCITEDGDAFLFGARTVYRHFSCTAAKKQDDQMCVYQMNDIENDLELSREHLVAFAILTGCDYYEGVKGIGQAMALRLIKELQTDTILDRFRRWRTDSVYYEELESYKKQARPNHCSRCHHLGKSDKHGLSGCTQCQTLLACTAAVDGEAERSCTCTYCGNMRQVCKHEAEMKVRRTALKDTNFPPEHVIKEFLGEKDFPSVDLKWKKPNIDKTKEFLREELKWVTDRAEKYLLPILTSWTLRYPNDGCLTPNRVIKYCTERGQPLVEIEWKTNEGGLTGITKNTREDRNMFTKVYPDLISAHEEEMKEKQNKSKHTPKKRNQAEVLPKRGRITHFFKSKKAKKTD